MEPLFNVEDNSTLVLVGLMKKCKVTKPLINLLTQGQELKSAAIFTSIIALTPRINKVLQERCLSQ